MKYNQAFCTANQTYELRNLGFIKPKKDRYTFEELCAFMYTDNILTDVYQASREDSTSNEAEAAAAYLLHIIRNNMQSVHNCNSNYRRFYTYGVGSYYILIMAVLVFVIMLISPEYSIVYLLSGIVGVLFSTTYMIIKIVK